MPLILLDSSWSSGTGAAGSGVTGTAFAVSQGPWAGSVMNGRRRLPPVRAEPERVRRDPYLGGRLCEPPCRCPEGPSYRTPKGVVACLPSWAGKRPAGLASSTGALVGRPSAAALGSRAVTPQGSTVLTGFARRPTGEHLPVWLPPDATDSVDETSNNSAGNAGRIRSPVSGDLRPFSAKLRKSGHCKSGSLLA